MRILATALGAALLPATGLAVEFNQVQLDKSRISFVSHQMSVPVEGSFGRFDARLVFDPAKPEAARAQLEIELGSIDAGGPEANEEVKSKNWFNVREHPRASFVSSSIKPLGGNRYTVTGKLTLKGKTLTQSAPVTVALQGNQAVINGAFTLKRLDYGIGGGDWGDTSIVADEVEVKIHLVALATTSQSSK